MIIGWDVSTSAIGICVRRSGLPDLYNVIFPKGETHLEKHIFAVRAIEQFLSLVLYDKDGVMSDVTHLVEERLGGFTGGLTSKQTLMALAAMNAVVSHHLAYTGKVIHIPPVTTKRITGLVVLKDETKKQAVIKLARSSDVNFPYKEKANGEPVKGVDDLADAWLLAQAGEKILSGEATFGPKKKAGGAKGKARRAKGTGKA